jgi:hypothetical protein
MTDHFAQVTNILAKTRRHTLRGPQIHCRPHANQEAAAYHRSSFYDAVRLGQVRYFVSFAARL